MVAGFSIGQLHFSHGLIQGPLAGYTCAPMRELPQLFTPPAYAFSEMISAQDVLSKHDVYSRYLYRSPKEGLLCYQLSGTEPQILREASLRLQDLGANLIDLNCACPKPKIRKKGAGSAHLDNPDQLIKILADMRSVLSIPLTVKIRLQSSDKNIILSKSLENVGVDAIIVHGRSWQDDYTIPCRYDAIAEIKQSINIPVIANGDIKNLDTLKKAILETGCDGYLISRAACGRPWIFEQLLSTEEYIIEASMAVQSFKVHIEGLSDLQNEHIALLQSRSLLKYYFRDFWDLKVIEGLMRVEKLKDLFEAIEKQSTRQDLVL